jgi:hypothetical protein
MFAEGVTTRQSADAGRGSIMRKAAFTTARALFVAGATGLLVMAMLTAPTAAWASSGGCTSSSPCFLAFAAGGQPAGTTVNTTITSSFDTPPPGAGPVQVEVVDGSGNLVGNAKASITIAITSTANPGSGKLSGTKTVSTSGGVASFSDLSINQPGVGYRLTATSRGLGSVDSGHFTIWSSIQHCSTRPCSASASSATTSGTVTTSSADSTQFLGTGISGSTYSCPGTYQPVSDQFSFDVVSGTGDMGQGAQFTVVLRIGKSLVQHSTHPGASTWQICYASTSPFTPRSGNPGTATIGDTDYFTGLLPDCSNTAPVAPCVQSRTKDNAGDVLVTFLASGDPFGRG